LINNELNNFKSIYLKNLRHKKDRLKAFKPNLLAIFIVVMDCLKLDSVIHFLSIIFMSWRSKLLIFRSLALT